VDIQVAKEFAGYHFSGSMETNAFPIKSDSDRKKIDPVVARYKETGHDVVVVCPLGGGGAKCCYFYLKSQGVPESKLFILKGGVDKWPYRDMLTAK
jgi:rhodanese-related sulfurtransferase